MSNAAGKLFSKLVLEKHTLRAIRKKMAEQGFEVDPVDAPLIVRMLSIKAASLNRRLSEEIS